MKIQKNTIILIGIFLIALVLRIIAAHNSHVSTDEMIYSIIPLNIISTGNIGHMFQSHLYNYLADISYFHFGGITPISIRFPSIIFGALTIFIIYIISIEIFNERRSALISSFLFSISGYALQQNTEMDMVAFFFSLFAIYFFIKALKKNYYYLLFTSLFLAISIQIKTIIIFFIPALLIIFLIKIIKRKEFLYNGIKINKKVFKVIILCSFLFILVISPVFIYNYLTYKESGLTDFYLSSLGLGNNQYENLENKPWSLLSLKKSYINHLKILFNIDLILLIFFIPGLIYGYKKEKYFSLMLVLSLIFMEGYVGGVTGTGSHFIWSPVILSIFTGHGISKLNFYSKIKFKYLLHLIILISLISSFFVLSEILDNREQSITLALRDYSHNNIEEESIVVIDPRIYRGIHAWVFNDKHYLEGTTFFGLSNQFQNNQEIIVNVPLYYIECYKGSNCGWKPEDFQRIYSTGEEITNYFKENTYKIAEIRTEHNFNIYKGNIKIPTNLYEKIDRTHMFWSYPVGWKYPEQAIDYYEPKGFDMIFNSLGHIILWINVIIALFTIPFTFFLVFKKK